MFGGATVVIAHLVALSGTSGTFLFQKCNASAICSSLWVALATTIQAVLKEALVDCPRDTCLFLHYLVAPIAPDGNSHPDWTT